MPIYEYRCNTCGYQNDYLQKISEPPLTDCPECGKSTFAKQVTAAGFQLKGTGWYATDFKNNGKSKAKEAGKSESGSESESSATSERGKGESGKSESGKSESGKSESGKSESGKSESGKSESGKSESRSGADSGGGKPEAPARGAGASPAVT